MSSNIITSDIILAHNISGSPTTAGTQLTVYIRHLIRDMTDRSIRFNLPFQRKQVWKLSQEQQWIMALIRNTLPDPISVSLRDSVQRGINGGNRCRSILKFTQNKFPIVAEYEGRNYSVWFSVVPEAKARSKLHMVMSQQARDRFLGVKIHLNQREGLTDVQEHEWYLSMNKNSVKHTEGQLLLVDMCEANSGVFVQSLLVSHPVFKARIQVESSPEDEASIGTFLSEKFDVTIDPMNDEDSNEDCLLAVARCHNMLANGHVYRNGFKGEFDAVALAENEAMLRDILNSWTPSDEMKIELAMPSATKKKHLPNAYAPSYLLGVICWSIANRKPAVVDTWKAFLARVVPGMIEATYGKANSEAHQPDTNEVKYSTSWDAVCRMLVA